LKHPKYKDVWSKSFGKEIQCLTTTTKTIAFVAKQDIPQARCRNITYGRIVCNYCLKKKDPRRTHIRMEGHLINYPNDCRTPTANILTIKLLFNSVISMPNAKFMTIDIKDFYLMMPMDCYEYFRINSNSSHTHRTSSTNMHSVTKWTQMAMFSVKCNVECMASHRLASLCKISSPNAFTKQDTARAQSPQDTGGTIGNHQLHPCC
jgi:hypothetical protein